MVNKLQTISNDKIGRHTKIARSGTKMTETRNDAYGYNDRSELISASKNGVDEYAYQYDDIGNRETAFELGTNFTYDASNLNQYTTVGRGLRAAPLEDVLSPTYDLDGNQTLVKTKTGIWSVTYNGENRPISWSCGTTNIVMKFDRMGRRVEYIEREGETTLKHQRFVYDGYLSIQRLNGANNAVADLFEWDPTEPVATRPLFWQPRTAEGNFSLFYTHDGNKNVSEVVFYQRARGVAAHYEYAPFGEVTVQTRGNAWGSIDLSALSPWRFSSECADELTSLVCFVFRNYEPSTSRWLSTDPYEGSSGLLSHNYLYVGNRALDFVDILGFKVYNSRANVRRTPVVLPSYNYGGRKKSSKRNPGHRKFEHPQQHPMTEPISGQNSSELFDEIQGIANLLEETVAKKEKDAGRTDMDEMFGMYYLYSEAAKKAGIAYCEKKDILRRSSYRANERSVNMGSGPSLEQGMCMCCEMLIVERIVGSVGDIEVAYALDWVVYHEESCDKVMSRGSIYGTRPDEKHMHLYLDDFRGR